MARGLGFGAAVKLGTARLGQVRPGAAWHRKAVKARIGRACPGSPGPLWRGKAGKVRLVVVRGDRYGKAVEVRYGSARLGGLVSAGQSRRERLVWSRRGSEGKAVKFRLVGGRMERHREGGLAVEVRKASVERTG